MIKKGRGDFNIAWQRSPVPRAETNILADCRTRGVELKKVPRLKLTLCLILTLLQRYLSLKKTYSLLSHASSFYQSRSSLVRVFDMMAASPDWENGQLFKQAARSSLFPWQWTSTNKCHWMWTKWGPNLVCQIDNHAPKLSGQKQPPHDDVSQAWLNITMTTTAINQSIHRNNNNQWKQMNNWENQNDMTNKTKQNTEQLSQQLKTWQRRIRSDSNEQLIIYTSLPNNLS